MKNQESGYRVDPADAAIAADLRELHEPVSGYRFGAPPEPLLADNPNVTEDGISIFRGDVVGKVAKNGISGARVPADITSKAAQLFTPSKGFKLTDVHGGNAVICKIHPDVEAKEK